MGATTRIDGSPTKQFFRMFQIFMKDEVRSIALFGLEKRPRRNSERSGKNRKTNHLKKIIGVARHLLDLLCLRVRDIIIMRFLD